MGKWKNEQRPFSTHRSFYLAHARNQNLPKTFHFTWGIPSWDTTSKSRSADRRSPRRPKKFGKNDIKGYKRFCELASSFRCLHISITAWGTEPIEGSSFAVSYCCCEDSVKSLISSSFVSDSSMLLGSIVGPHINEYIWLILLIVDSKLMTGSIVKDLKGAKFVVRYSKISIWMEVNLI